MTLYYPPTLGNNGHKPSDWPSGALPQSIEQARAEAARAGEELFVFNEVERANAIPPIEITGGAQAAGWLNRNWPLVAGGIALLILGSLITRPR